MATAAYADMREPRYPLPAVSRALSLRQRLADEVPHLAIDSVLGEGGSAFVFGAMHTLLGIPLAVKVLRDTPDVDPDGAARLRIEARLCAAVGEDVAPRALDASQLRDGTPYFVMERCSGAVLSAHADLCDLSVVEVVDIGLGLLDALAALHRHGIVHRDIKPQNIMLDGQRNGRPRVRVIDLGLAKPIASQKRRRAIQDDAQTLMQLTQPGTFVGTPSYIAPEQLMGKTTDQRADLYSAGATIYHLLTGCPPFQHEDIHQTLAACLRDPLPPIESLRRGVPAAVQRVIERALSREPAQRYDSAEAMHAALSDARD